MCVNVWGSGCCLFFGVVWDGVLLELGCCWWMCWSSFLFCCVVDVIDVVLYWEVWVYFVFVCFNWRGGWLLEGCWFVVCGCLRLFWVEGFLDCWWVVECWVFWGLVLFWWLLRCVLFSCFWVVFCYDWWWRWLVLIWVGYVWWVNWGFFWGGCLSVVYWGCRVWVVVCDFWVRIWLY